MKSIKTFLMAGLSMVAFTAFAQEEEAEYDLNTLQFVKADGTVVPDGTTLTIAPENPEETPEGTEINSGLYVQNTTDGAVLTCVSINCEKLDNGNLSCCFPFTCQNLMEVGEAKSQVSDLNASEKRDFKTEWYAQDYGSCTGTFQIELYEETLLPGQFMPTQTLKAYGPKITINFVYNDPASISGVTNENAGKAVAYYNAAGQQIDNLQKGINFIKYSNGKTVKTVIK